MRQLYTALLFLSLPLLMARLWWRGRRLPSYRKRWGERLGFHVPAIELGRPLIWIHAVSVGEVVVASQLIRRLRASYPQHQLFVTTSTPTGSERLLSEFGDSVLHMYLPWDLQGPLRRVLDRVRPQLILLIETELWPNLLAQAKDRKIPVVLINGRLSAKSARRYSLVPSLRRTMLEQLTLVIAQAKHDAQRFRALGVPRDQISVSGNIKFDQQLPSSVLTAAESIRADWSAATRPIVVAASTHDQEEQQVLLAFRRIKVKHPDTLLCIVPRHPDRFETVRCMIEADGWRYTQRSVTTAIDADTDVVLADTMGELVTLLGAADVAFIGCSLVPTGGHNMLEAAQWGVAVVTGPHLFNFAAVKTLLLQARALLIADDPDDLGLIVSDLLASAGQRRAMGQRGQEAVERQRGALDRVMEALESLL